MKVGRLPVVSPFSRCMVVVGGSARNLDQGYIFSVLSPTPSRESFGEQYKERRKEKKGRKGEIKTKYRILDSTWKKKRNIIMKKGGNI